MISVAVAIAFVLFRSARPRVCVLGRIPGTKTYKSTKSYKNAIKTHGVLAIRFDSSLYFTNVSYLKDKSISLINKENYPVYCLILDCSSINQVDSSAISGLIQLSELLKEHYACELLLCNVKPPVLKVFERGGLTKNIPKTNFFDEMHAAMLHAENVAFTIAREKKVKEATKRSISELDLASFAQNPSGNNINIEKLYNNETKENHVELNDVITISDLK